MMFGRNVMQDIEKVANEFGIEPAALAAIAEIESGGFTHAMVEGRAEPLIRFEGHYFDQRLSEAMRERARNENLASPKAGGIKNPSSQIARWKLLHRAAKINRDAAYESVSWGMGQVMGAHWRWLGFSSVDALVQEARKDVQGQLRLMARFIRKSNLIDVLNKHDWAAFARVYNGPAYRKNKYDTKLGRAYLRYSASKKLNSQRVLRYGMRGDDVQLLQEELVRIGYPLVMDGFFGHQTRQAVCDFQKTKRLSVDGVVGTATFAALQLSIHQPAFKQQEVGTRLAAWFARMFGVQI